MSKDREALQPQETELARSMSEFDITLIGVGAMIGAGIFVLIGIATGEAGPGVMLALVLNGVVTLFTAMVYAELGSAIPEAGGGYLWVKDALGRQQSFLAGWMSWFSHSVAGALYALGFGSFVVELVRRSGLVLPDLGPVTADTWVAALVVVAFLGINLRGASETGLAGNIITLAKLSVIMLFVVFGIAAIFGSPAESIDRFQPMFPQGSGGVLTAMGLTFIAFEGYEIIVQAGEEVREPSRAIPRAVFKSLIVVIPIYALVAFTMIGAVDPPAGSTIGEFLGAAGELGLAEAADEIMPAGAIVILVGGILSTISALNATTYSSTRVSYAMGRDRVMPDSFARVHERFRTPHVALGATGVLVLLMVFFLPIEAVAAAADVMFLLLFLQVHYAVIRIRGEMGDRIDYGYVMPWYPWVPILGIILNAGLAIFLVFYELVGWLVAVGWIVLGVVVFFTYSRNRVREEDEPTVTWEDKRGTRSGRAVLAPVGNPDNVGIVLALAAAWARARDAEVVALNVVRVPPQLRLSQGRSLTSGAQPVIDRVREVAEETPDVRFSTVVAAGRSISGVIDDVADREGASAVVLGWKGTVHPDTVRGSVAQEVLRTSGAGHDPGRRRRRRGSGRRGRGRRRPGGRVVARLGPAREPVRTFHRRTGQPCARAGGDGAPPRAHPAERMAPVASTEVATPDLAMRAPHGPAAPRSRPAPTIDQRHAPASACSRTTSTGPASARATRPGGVGVGLGRARWWRMLGAHRESFHEVPAGRIARRARHGPRRAVRRRGHDGHVRAPCPPPGDCGGCSPRLRWSATGPAPARPRSTPTRPPRRPSPRSPACAAADGRRRGPGRTGDAVLADYLPVLLLFVLAFGFAGASIGVSSLVGPTRPNPTKLDAYECGNVPLGQVKGTRFSVKFYLVAMMFLIFDIETVFVYPWAIASRGLGWFGFTQMLVFLGILGIAFVYEIGRGGLSWD